MKRLVIIFSAITLLSGCATVFTQPGKTEADFDKDRDACEILVRQDLAAKGMPDT